MKGMKEMKELNLRLSLTKTQRHKEKQTLSSLRVFVSPCENMFQVVYHEGREGNEGIKPKIISHKDAKAQREVKLAVVV